MFVISFIIGALVVLFFPTRSKKYRGNKVISDTHLPAKKNYHRHKCTSCNTVWEHSNSPKGEHKVKAHTCPKCGRLGYWKLR